MPIPLIMTLIIGLPTVILSVISQTALWQRKEYRWDRMRSFFLSPESVSLWHPLLISCYITVTAGWIAFLGSFIAFATYAGWVALLSCAAYHIDRIHRQGVIRPVWTVKAIALLATITAAVLLYLRFTFTARELIALQWATLLFFLPALATLSTVIVNIPFDLRKHHTIEEAKRLRKKHKGLRTVGITGSYGKTSTKHFLRHIMKGSHLASIATKEHRNSEFSVAIDMLEQLTKKANVYIAEMGAYRVGEIAALAELAKPQVAVITAIGNQHISLFGSRENIAAAKWELVEGLPSDGTVVLNADDDILQQKGKNVQQNIIWYSLKKRANVWAEHITVHPEHIEMTLHIGEQTDHVRVPIISEGLLGSVMAAVAAAYVLGVPAGHITKQLHTIKSFERTMEVQKGINGSTIIDDSYSASEQGVINAVKHLAHFPQQDKRIALVPIIELGEEGPAVHERIGKLLASSHATVFIYGTAYKQNIQHGINASGKKMSVQWITDPYEMKEKVSQDVSSKTVVLLEGRLPDIVRKSLLSNS